MGLPEKTDRNKRIVRMVEEEGRTYIWIGRQEGISEKNVRKIYFRERARREKAGREVREVK